MFLLLFLLKRAQKLKKTKAIFPLYWIALVQTQKPHKIGLISVHTWDWWFWCDICNLVELYLLQSRKHIVTYRSSLRSKCFCLVSQQRKTKKQDFWFWPCKKWNKSQKMKEGGGEAKHFIGQLWQHQMSVHELRHDRPSGGFLKSRGLSASISFLSSPSPFRSYIFYVVFDSRSSFFAPKPHGNAGYAG